MNKTELVNDGFAFTLIESKTRKKKLRDRVFFIIEMYQMTLEVCLFSIRMIVRVKKIMNLSLSYTLISKE